MIVKNARDLKNGDFNLPLDMIVADLSFISATFVMEVFSNLLTEGKNLILLVKPQFETGEKKKFKNGIVKDLKIHRSVCENIFNYAMSVGLTPIDFTTAPKQEGKNVEFLMLFVKGQSDNILDIEKIKYS
jgi:23S rRNA (cytidine1920-2'-O)/16S rRNA (cytidine1409-2'-O)-methyltransferase